MSDEVLATHLQELRRGTVVMAALATLRRPTYGYALLESLAEAVALHDDMAAKARLIGPHLGQGSAQVGLDQAWRHDMAPLGQGRGIDRRVIPPRALSERGGVRRKPDRCGIDHGDILPRRPLFFYPPAA